MRSKHGGSDPGVLEKIFEKIDLEEYRKAKWGSVLRKIIKKMEKDTIFSWNSHSFYGCKSTKIKH